MLYDLLYIQSVKGVTPSINTMEIIDQILIVNTLIHCFPFQATVRLHSCCMMTCTLNGGPDMVTEGARGDLEAGRRMPGRRWCVGVLRDGATRLMPALCPLGAAHK